MEPVRTSISQSLLLYSNHCTEKLAFIPIVVDSLETQSEVSMVHKMESDIHVHEWSSSKEGVCSQYSHFNWKNVLHVTAVAKMRPRAVSQVCGYYSYDEVFVLSL